ncbi:MAG: TraR/DksA family transcriptional regulator, partial [Ilumatobacter sp.]
DAATAHAKPAAAEPAVAAPAATDQALVAQRARLIGLRAANARRANGLSRGFEAIVEAASDVATDDEHDPEGHTIAWERQQLAALLDEATSATQAIEAAIERVDGGRYGICTECGGEIAPERLDALPATPRCVACAV